MGFFYLYDMSTKLQVIVPIFPDPLLCQLYFRNYIKYKHKYVDRLFIIIYSTPIRNRVMKDANNEIIRRIGYDMETYRKHIEEIKQLLSQLNITNYDIKCYDEGGGHGEMFHVALNEIYDSDYHTLFDEQDAYWLNDNFKQYVDQLNHLDLIGGIKSRIPYLETPDQLDKFNKRFGTNHVNQLFTLHLPEFLSNRVIKQIKNFSGKQNNIDPRTYADNVDVNTVFLDTFQTLNLDIYKITDKVKLIPYLEWDLIEDFYKKKPSINFDDYVLCHLGHAGSIAFMTFFEMCEMDDMNQHLSLICRQSANPRYEVRFGFLYQAMDRISGFKYITPYKKNMENGSTVISIDTNKPVMDLMEYNCYSLIERIL